MHREGRRALRSSPLPDSVLRHRCGHRTDSRFIQVPCGLLLALFFLVVAFLLLTFGMLLCLLFFRMLFFAMARREVSGRMWWGRSTGTKA